MLAGGVLPASRRLVFGGGTQLRCNEPAGQGAGSVDGQLQDVAPVSLQRIEPGQHLLEVRKDGYQSVCQDSFIV